MSDNEVTLNMMEEQKKLATKLVCDDDDTLEETDQDTKGFDRCWDRNVNNLQARNIEQQKKMVERSAQQQEQLDVELKQQ